VLENWKNPDPNENSELLFDAKTLITFDNGNEWTPVTPPVGSNCTGMSLTRCSLNLFGVTTWLGFGGSGYFGNFYSAPEAVGLILATGNEGQYLKTDAKFVNTYMSRDGGLSWTLLRNGSTVYEFVDHGGVLALVPNQVPTTTMYYSVDEGLTWKSFQFASTPTVVTSIFTLSSSQKAVTVFGHYDGTTQAVYYGIDFSNIQERKCTANDYEQWSAKDGTKNCVLGRSTVYLRRKQSAPCYNDDKLNHIASVTNCNCTVDDYECDFNYERTEISGVCAKVADTPTYCGPDNTYTQSQGYRKLPGDSCVNEVAQYAPIIKKCNTGNTNSNTNGNSPVYGNDSTISSLGIGLIVIAVVIVLVIVLLTGIVLGARSERVRNAVPCLRSTPFHSGYSTKLPLDDVEDVNEEN